MEDQPRNKNCETRQRASRNQGPILGVPIITIRLHGGSGFGDPYLEILPSVLVIEMDGRKAKKAQHSLIKPRMASMCTGECRKNRRIPM